MPLSTVPPNGQSEERRPFFFRVPQAACSAADSLLHGIDHTAGAAYFLATARRRLEQRPPGAGGDAGPEADGADGQAQGSLGGVVAYGLGRLGPDARPLDVAGSDGQPLTLMRVNLGDVDLCGRETGGWTGILRRDGSFDISRNCLQSIENSTTVPESGEAPTAAQALPAVAPPSRRRQSRLRRLVPSRWPRLRPSTPLARRRRHSGAGSPAMLLASVEVTANNMDFERYRDPGAALLEAKVSHAQFLDQSGGWADW